MEMQQPPQKPISTIVISDCSNNNRPHRTLPTTRQLQAAPNYIKHFNKQIKKVIIRFELLVKEFDNDSKITNCKFTELENKSKKLKEKIVSLERSKPLKSDELEKSLKPLPMKNIENSLNILSIENFEEQTEDPEISEKSTNDSSLNFDHSLNVSQKLEQLEEKIESFRYFFGEYLDEDQLAKSSQTLTIDEIQESIDELVKSNEELVESNDDLVDAVTSLKEQIQSIDELKQNIKIDIKLTYKKLVALNTIHDESSEKIRLIQQELTQLREKIQNNINELIESNDELVDALKEQIQSIDELKNIHDESSEKITLIQQELAQLREEYGSQKLLINLINTKNMSLANTMLQQSQSISTLQRWLMAIGGGSAIALTIWLWHYIHNK